MNCNPSPTVSAGDGRLRAQPQPARPAPAARERRGDGALHQSAAARHFSKRAMAGAANRCRLRISNGVLDSPNWWPIRRNSASTPPRRCCRPRCRAASAYKSSCRRPPPPGCVAITIRRPADQVWSIEELSQRGIFRRTRQAGRSARRHRGGVAAPVGDRPTTRPSCVSPCAAARTSWCRGPPGRVRRPGPRR